MTVIDPRWPADMLAAVRKALADFLPDLVAITTTRRSEAEDEFWHRMAEIARGES